MRRVKILAAGVALSVACALPVWAADAYENAGEHENAAETGHVIKKGTEATGHAAAKTGLTSREAARYGASERAQHRMFGHVAEINHASGAVEVKTAETSLQLQFPPKAVRAVKKGDAITVEMGYAMADTGTAATAYDAPKTHGAKKGTPFASAHWMKGTVAEINHDSGIVSVKTEKDQMLTLHFPPNDIASLNAGDQIAVEMAFQKGNHSQKARRG